MTLRTYIEERAGHRCEYCGMHQSLQGATFHIEHVVPRSRGGNSTPENLALACPRCNLHKADRVEAVDPVDGDLVRLFDPRSNHWRDHFRWSGRRIVPITPIGRATAEALDLNHPRRIRVRHVEEAFGLFPP